jgi:hypothetical protein
VGGQWCALLLPLLHVLRVQLPLLQVNGRRRLLLLIIIAALRAAA